MKLRNFFSALVLASSFAATFIPVSSTAQVNKDLPVVELTIKTSKLKAEVAADNNTRATGLMNRFSLKPDSGMVFVFAQSEPLAFWMKNCFIPLSIAYIDSKGVIVSIVDMKPQDESTYPSGAPAMFALEMKQGWFKERGIVVGDKVSGLETAGRAKN